MDYPRSTADRKTISAKPFIKKSEAEDAMFAMSGSGKKK